MNYPEELRERYNEVMYDERDIIQKFLEKQYDIRYGRQRDTWHFEPAVKVLSRYGNVEHVTDIMLDKDRFVIFIIDDAREYECFDFAYGELSKIIEALPDVDEIVKKNAVDDLYEYQNNLLLDSLLEESPFVYELNGELLRFDGVKAKNKVYNFETIAEKNGVDFITKFRDHINIELLHRTRDYQRVMELLALEENLQKSVDDYDKVRYGVVTFTLDKTDVVFDLVSVRRDDSGNLVIFGCDKDNTEDTITLTEKDIKREYLVPILKWLSSRPDIIDEHNGHNMDLVRKINTAWKDEKYYPLFGGILLALLIRDHLEFEHRFCKVDDYSEEWAMNHAHEIMEGVCDDLDLETILGFVRYEEE